MKKKGVILIVDDEPIAREVMEGLLFQEGYELTFAANGSEALSGLEERVPDVILLDVMMPGMNGFEVCRRLKTSEQWRHIPIILVTALGSKEDLVRGFEAGANDFLAKPVNELELRARVRSMLQIKQQYDEIEATLRLRDELASMIVHDMRSPLTVILGYSEMLLMNSTDAPEHIQEIEKIHSQAHRLNSFLNDMLMLAKMEADQPILNRSPVDVNQLVKQVVESNNVIAESRNIPLIVELPVETKQVWLDENLFQRVLDNLISNALKFSPAESTVTVQLEYPIAPTSEAKFRIKVLDEGPGVSEEHRARIFHKFEIVALKGKDTPQVGLGLAFCKIVVEAHGGIIFVEANKPVGSVFTVEI
jgi:two-component system sensor histidine kinase/response regulator